MLSEPVDVAILLDAMEEGVLILDATGTITQCNPAASRILRNAGRPLVGSHMQDLACDIIDESGTPVVYVNRPHAIAHKTGRRVRGAVLGFREEGEETKWVLVNASPMPADAEEKTHMLLTFTEVTNIRHRADQLALSVRKYAALFNNIPIGVFTSTPEGVITDCNDELARMARVDGRQVLIGNDTRRFFQNLDDLAHFLDTLAHERHIENFEIAMFRADATEICVMFSARLIEVDGDAPYILGTVMDVTEVKTLEGEKKQLELQLKEETHKQHLATLTTKVGHEVNNLMHELEQIRRQQQSHNDHLGRIVQRGKTTTKMVLDTSRDIIPEPRTVRINSWMRSYVNEARHVYDDVAKITLQLDPGNSCVHVDVSLLGQVFANVAKNAVEATGTGCVIAISAHCIPEESIVLITIADNGPGMDEATQARIFEPLFSTKHQGNMGLGLAHSHAIVHALGGEITVESAPGTGAVFSIRLPRGSCEDVRAYVPQSTHLTDLPKRVLIVDDERGIADGMKVVLEMDGIDVLCVYEGADVPEAIEMFQPEIVILDVGLQDMPGYEVYHLIDLRWPTLPVLFSTGHADPNTMQPYLQKPHVGFLQKPYGSGELTEAMQKVLHAAANP